MYAIKEAYHTLFDAVPSALAIVQKDGICRNINASFSQQFGVEPSNLIGKTLVETGILLEASGKELDEAIRISGSKLTNFELPYFFQGRYPRLSLFSVAKFPLDGVDYLLYNVTDITLSRSYEQSLKEQIKYLCTITDNIPAMIFNYSFISEDVSWLNFVSKGSKELFGYTPEDFLADISIFYKSIHPEDFKAFMRSTKIAAEKYSNWEMEYKIKHKDGHYKWVKGRSAPFRKEKNGEVSWIGSLEDITERKLAEEKSKLTEKQLYHAVEHTPNLGIQWYNRKGEILYWNKASELMYGFTSEEALGKTLDNLILSQEEASMFVKALEQIEQTEEHFGPYENFVTHKNGEKRSVLASAYMIPGEAEEPVFVCMDFDITEQKKAQKALIESKEKLKKTNEELVKINKDLDRFVYSTSHDLRAPISSLIGLIDISKRETKIETLHLYLEKQQKIIKKMDDFIKEIVDYTRNGKQVVNLERLNLKNMIEEIYEQYSYMDNAQLVHKTLEIVENAPFYSDKQRLTTVLSNLISNSLKYVDLTKKDPAVNVKVKIEPEMATIEVKDNGEGIQQEYLSSIFDMFYRATTTSFGSGIGLYIVKEVLAKLEGTIEVVSEVGEGSIFKILVPNKIMVF